MACLPAALCSVPESTTLPYKSFLMSTSHFMMELKAVSSMPAASMPTMLGVNSTSGQRNRSLPIVMTCGGRAACEQRVVQLQSGEQGGSSCLPVSARPAAHRSTDRQQACLLACQPQHGHSSISRPVHHTRWPAAGPMVFSQHSLFLLPVADTLTIC